ncbi:MAG: imidazolonepropionase [Chloroflexi bacterium CFX4]|nr:imidazolonepropionase [Chloroflexi bacterium CFX4]MDL1922599.1 imidazolonepropionase [Chloroflexi bacterium CFX3]
MMRADVLIVHAAQLVTCAGGGQPKRGAAMRDVCLIEDGALAIRDGRILAVGKTAAIRADYAAETVISVAGKVVCPGLVDCHTHAVYGGNRLDEFEQRLQGVPYMQIMADGGGIASTARATRAAAEDDLLTQAHARLDQMMQHGTTTAEIKTGYGLDTSTELKLLNVIAALDRQHPMTILPTFLGAHAVPWDYANAEQYLAAVIDDMLPAVARSEAWRAFRAQGINGFIDVFCEQGVFDLEQARRVLLAGRDGYGMQVKAHVDEFVSLGGAAMACEIGAVSVDHLDVTPPHALERLAQSNTVGVMLPAVNFNLGSTHFGNARHLIEAGGSLALATDLNPGSAPTPSLPLVMAIACRYQKLLPSEALNACTINAAAALNMAERVGSLEVGKQADLIILNTDDYRALAYEFGSQLVEMVIIKGDAVWRRSA